MKLANEEGRDGRHDLNDPSTMVKRRCFHPPTPGAPRRAPSRNVATASEEAWTHCSPKSNGHPRLLSLWRVPVARQWATA